MKPRFLHHPKFLRNRVCVSINYTFVQKLTLWVKLEIYWVKHKPSLFQVILLNGNEGRRFPWIICFKSTVLVCRAVWLGALASEYILPSCLLVMWRLVNLKTVTCHSLLDPTKIYLPPLHVQLGLMKVLLNHV